MEINTNFWKNKNVLITGHTGFKGTWLSLWLSSMGAIVSGYSLKPNKDQFFYKLIYKEIKFKKNIYGDIKNKKKIDKAIKEIKPEIVIHLAAQALVGISYDDPLNNYHTNINGTLNLLECVRKYKAIKVFLNVTTDKCYKNTEKNISYTESDPLGGMDPYSSSKACSEIITSAYYNSFLKERVGVATARAGNVIGGGDWSRDRLIPDLIKAIKSKKKFIVRNPEATRPWQHVLEPLSGYILLCENLYKKPTIYSQAWNFGPSEKCNISVNRVIKKVSEELGEKIKLTYQKKIEYYESKLLMLDSSKASKKLGWKTKLDIDKSINMTISWYKVWIRKKNIFKYSIDQIEKYKKI